MLDANMHLTIISKTLSILIFMPLLLLHISCTSVFCAWTAQECVVTAEVSLELHICKVTATYILHYQAGFEITRGKIFCLNLPSA